MTLAEGDGTVALGVELSAPSALEIAVDFTAADGSATAGDDFSVVNGTLTFAAGETAATIEVAVLDDALDEIDERLFA